MSGLSRPGEIETIAITSSAYPLQCGQLAEDLSHALAPLTAQRSKIGIARVEPPAHPNFETVPLVADQIDRHADREVAAHGRIERDQHALRRIGKRRGRGDDAIDDRFAVLRFTGLQKGRITPRLDEVSLGVDPKQPQRLAADLSAEDERGVELDGVSPPDTGRRGARCRASRPPPDWRRRTSSARSTRLGAVGPGVAPLPSAR